MPNDHNTERHVRASVSTRRDGAERASGERLGIYPIFVDSQNRVDDEKSKEINRLSSRRQRYADLRTAALILREKMPERIHAVAKCRWIKVQATVDLTVRVVGAGQKRATFRGVKICGNVWGCQVCAARISQVRRAEMNKMLKWARKNKLVPILLTLTARHGKRDSLESLLNSMKEAKRRLRQRDEWKRLPFRGSVTATEMTNGKIHGWHPHFHEIVLLDAADEDAALDMVAPLGDAWRASLRAFGLDGAAAAFDARGAASAGDYVAKWGAAEEITMTGAKVGRGKGRSISQLLQDAENGDRAARELWFEYFNVTSVKRRRQLRWSPGLKDACGVNEVSDQAAAEAAEVEPEIIVQYGNTYWRQVRGKRVNLLEAAEKGGRVAVKEAEKGPDDHADDEAVIEDEDGQLSDENERAPRVGRKWHERPRDWISPDELRAEREAARAVADERLRRGDPSG